jgi:hypothetical protein
LAPERNIEAPPIPVQVSDHAVQAVVAVDAEDEDTRIEVIIFSVVHLIIIVLTLV